MKRTNENSNGITMISLAVTIALMIILAGITISITADTRIIPSAENSQKQYNEMVENIDNAMGADQVFNLLELD